MIDLNEHGFYALQIGTLRTQDNRDFSLQSMALGHVTDFKTFADLHGNK